MRSFRLHPQRAWRTGLNALYVLACACVLFGWADYLRSPAGLRVPHERVAPAFTPRFSPRVARATPNVSVAADPVRELGIVWVNIPSRIYHYPGYRWFGTTQRGKYMQEGAALAEGDRAALNERRPRWFPATTGAP